MTDDAHHHPRIRAARPGAGAGMNTGPLRYTLLEQGAQHDLLPAALRHGIGVVYNSGLLARDRPPADATYDYQQAPPELVDRATRIATVCESYGVTLPEAALAFVQTHPAVVSTVVGLRSQAQVTETLRRASAVVPDALWPALRAAGLIEPSTELA
jgi:aryl-alcohol dehydrogenase-like predicted oxidoreductase